jgi:hypothetical protein
MDIRIQLLSMGLVGETIIICNPGLRIFPCPPSSSADTLTESTADNGEPFHLPYLLNHSSGLLPVFGIHVLVIHPPPEYIRFFLKKGRIKKNRFIYFLLERSVQYL